ncbi:hypothetical protein EXIGLDRAFT_748390 [Exidia glandulosa HHB12029]|uniref:Uncharacterized protein n=1 Tax=Exidia glandulosa HHB12029 TaxID=1314781 RepID=A0A165JK70_EXIGL|nr:hypothetical protein EXIGLDRAFT_748390 [Exidia glandulosa HHB12029]
MERPWPVEILLDIFERIAEWDTKTYAVKRIAATRPASLAACTRVCRAWNGPATMVLYRELSCISFADHDSQTSTMSCRNANRLLLATLSARPELAAHIRTFQLGFGTDCARTPPMRYGSLDMMVELLSLCLNLIHVDIILGCIQLAYPQELAKLKQPDMLLLSKLRRVQTLTVRGVEDHACELIEPASDVILQFLKVWPSVQILSVSIADRTRSRWWLPPTLKAPHVLPRLREIRHGNTCGDYAISPLLPFVPNLAHALLMHPSQELISELPLSLKRLSLGCFTCPLEGLDLQRLSQMHCLEGISLCGTEVDIEFALSYLDALPAQGIQSISLPIQVLAVAELLVPALARFPRLSAVVIRARSRLISPEEELEIMTVKSLFEQHVRQIDVVLEPFLGWDDVPRFMIPARRP